MITALIVIGSLIAYIPISILLVRLAEYIDNKCILHYVYGPSRPLKFYPLQILCVIMVLIAYPAMLLEAFYKTLAIKKVDVTKGDWYRSR